MNEREDHKPKLRLVQGSGHSALVVGAVRIFAGPEKMPPYSVEAIVHEEDTFLVLSANPELFESDENPMRVLTEAVEARPETPGSVVVKDGHPMQFLAIVHDLDQEPSWKEEWVANALDGVFREAEKRKFRSIALPLIGTLHGSLEKTRFIALLREALERKSPGHLKRLWLVTPEGDASEILEMLKKELQTR